MSDSPPDRSAALPRQGDAALWVVDLICCGQEDGTYTAASWQEADNFRESYCTGPGTVAGSFSGGHDRVGIIRKAVVVNA